MTPTLSLHNGSLFCDHSQFFGPLMECKQKHAYIALHKRIKAEEPVATQFGTCIHSVMEYRYKVYGTGKVDEAGRAIMSSIIQRHFDEHPSPFGEHRNQVFAEEITTRYLQKYPTEEFQLLEFGETKKCQHCFAGYERPRMPLTADDDPDPCVYCNATGLTRAMVELPFVVPLYEHRNSYGMDLSMEVIPVYYIGKIDLPLYHNSKLYVMDHKTTGFLDDKFFYAKKASQQTMMYAYAMWKLTGMKPDGYVINAIHTQEVPAYVREGRTYTYKGEKRTPEMYWENSLQRQWHSCTEEQLEGAKDNAIELCEQFFWSYARGKFPRSANDTTCVNKYNKCPYYTVCHEVAEADKLDFLASGAFMDNVWSPLNQITE